MATLYGFHDGGGRRHAVARIDGGDVVYIVVERSGVVVRTSRFGFFGCRLYRAKTLEEAAATAQRLEQMSNGQITPPGMDDPLLKTFTKAVLQCSSVAEVADLLNGEPERVDLEDVVAAGAARQFTA
jgi:hypothetical protein